MTVKRRRFGAEEASVEAWANEAYEPQRKRNEQARPAPPMPDLPAHRLRAKRGAKKDGALFRFNEEQRKLLDAAVLYEDMKQQELLESLVWEVLEERYGHLAPLD